MPGNHKIRSLFSPIAINKHNYHANNHYNMDNKYYEDTDIHLNTSKTQFMFVSGSNNQGSLFNDAQVNLTNIFEWPVFFYLHSHSMFIYILVITFLLMIAMILFLCIYHRYHRQLVTKRKQLSHYPFKKPYKHSSTSLNHAPDMNSKSLFLVSLYILFKYY